MTTFKYFADAPDGSVIELSRVQHDGHYSTKARHFSGIGPDGQKLHATRKIEFKKNPSLHKCDSRCMNAKGHVCECSCGGKNHGYGS